MKKRHLFITALFLAGSILNLVVASPVSEDPNPSDLLAKMQKAMGGWNKMYKLNDVQFDYYYEYQGVDKKDISQERYIFEGEHSWAKYTTHQINVMPEAGGTVIQAVVNDKAYMSHDGKKMDNAEALGGTMFLRKANYYWFTMMYKLNDPGTIVNYQGTETMNGTAYHKVAITFDSAKTGKEVNDAYILYINPKTNLVDQFYFSLPALGVKEPVMLMKLEYEKINGVRVPVKRSIFQPNDKGMYTESPNLVQISKNVKFNNGFKPSDLMIN